MHASYFLLKFMLNLKKVDCFCFFRFCLLAKGLLVLLMFCGFAVFPSRSHDEAP